MGDHHLPVGAVVVVIDSGDGDGLCGVPVGGHEGQGGRIGRDSGAEGVAVTVTAAVGCVSSSTV